MSKVKITQAKKALKKVIPGERGPEALIHNRAFQGHLIKALEICGDNGAKVHKYLLENYGEISYRTVHRYIRELFGQYPKTGRPPKYMKTQRREKV